ncbi:MAG: endopeptidase La [Chitinophagaceae bacterium]|nr:MAG: endopeptidase La [Chitinophagaceae bacterium]
MKDDSFFSQLIDDDVEFMPMLSLEEEDDINKDKIPEDLPILPLKNTVLFPGVILPITVGRDKSLKAVKHAYKKDKIIGVVSQKDDSVEDPEYADLNSVGTVARIIKMLKMPDGSSTIVIQGRKRLKTKALVSEEPFLMAKCELIEDIKPKNKAEFSAIISSIKDLAQKIIKLSPNIPSEASFVLKNMDSPLFLLHFISSNLGSGLKDKQTILEENDLTRRAEYVLEFLNNELQMIELKVKIQNKVQTDIEKQQKDYFLNQQLKTIQEELGGSSHDKEIKELKLKASKKKWPEAVLKAFNKDVERLQRTNPAAADYGLVLNYLELLLDLPWKKYTQDNFDLTNAQKVLDRDHHGLEKIKERIIEYLAVLKLKGDMKSPILCFVGPPGVGKTSLGKSIASALNRKYIRMSLGGLHDESEIRGHRKTYIGAMPGRILQSIKKADASNPVFVLDEVDKIGADFRGDPSSALLEVLDPEQNETFYDNYLELEYDLSKVLFIATANNINSIQPALRDRMEIIWLSGYSIEEKAEIAKKHLIPKLRSQHGLKSKQFKIGDTALAYVIERYTRESGVRELERKIAALMRRAAKLIASGEKSTVTISKPMAIEILGVATMDPTQYNEALPKGVAVGLAWTQTGGDILFIESSLSKGKESLTLTGNLGNVMKESASIALSFIKSNAEKFGISPETFENHKIHIHVPEGAIPKDGPSAGITILAALASVFSGKPIKKGIAMSGEITLRGKLLPVGGIKEKILAAKRAGLSEIYLCDKNQKDVDEINKEYIKGLNIVYKKTMMDVLSDVLT